MHNYAPLPVTFEKGEGALLWDTDGKQYLDALSGVAVCGLGHAHPAVAKAISEQASKLVHTSNWYHIANQEKLADKVDVTRQTIISIEGGRYVPSLELALKFAKLFKCKVEDLFG